MTIANDNSFAAACYNQNTLEELSALLSEDADAADMATWGLTEAEWSAQVDEAYRAKREDALARVRDYIADHLKPGLDADFHAAQLLDSAEEMGRIDGDDVKGEIASRHSATGNPISFEV